VSPVCYRHPDRPTGRACTRCGKPACPDCLVAASVGSHCLDCVKAALPPPAERLRRWNATQGGDLATKALIAINVAVFVAGIATDGGSALLDGSGSIIDRFALSLFDINHGEYWRLVTSGFVHLSLIHLALNMWALFQLGRALEGLLGRSRFVAVYFASLLAGSAVVLLFDRLGFRAGGLTAGASGAIFGLLGCLAAVMKSRGMSVMRSGIGVTLLINAVITLGIPHVSIGGHVGGFIGGAICGWLLLSPRPPVPRNIARLAPPIVAIASVIIAVAVSR
jgi:membrane associated rhomboid family serine protease